MSVNEKGPDEAGGLKLIDDPQKSRFLTPRLCSGGGGLLSTAADYMRFCQMMLNKGELDGVRLLGRKTVELMTRNHLDGDMADMGQPRFSESTYTGIGFGLGFSVMLDPARAQILGTPGEYAWGGAASWSIPLSARCSPTSPCCAPPPARSASGTRAAPTKSSCGRGCTPTPPPLRR